MRLPFPPIRWGFWLVVLAVSLPFLALLLSDVFSWDLGQAISAVAVVAAVLVLGLIFWRGVMLKGRVARTGLFWVLAFSLLAIALSLYFSPDRRMGLEQTFWSIGYVVIFFLLIEMFQSGVSKSGIFYGLLTASGVVAALAALEVYAWYAKYWQGTGTLFSVPPYP